MAKIAAILGATGTQGGSVARALLKDGWTVRAITRNETSDGAKKIASEGAALAVANQDDEASLVKAFEGAHAVFAVTNFWEHLFGGKSRDEAGKIEEQQAKNIANAAAKTSSLEHFVFSTLPNADKISGGKRRVQHFDYKAYVDEYIRADLPKLAKKTTYLWYGMYSTNFAYFPFLKPFEVPGSYGAHALIAPWSEDSKTPLTGDVNINSGLWVKAILNKPEISKGKYASVTTEILTWKSILEGWSEVTGKRAVFLKTTKEDYIKIWGEPGAEILAQLEFVEEFADWGQAQYTKEYGFVSQEELGITGTIGHKAALESLKALLA